MTKSAPSRPSMTREEDTRDSSISAAEAMLWESLRIARPTVVRKNHAERRLSQLFAAALRGEPHIVRDAMHRDAGGVLIISVSQLRRLVAPDPVMGSDVLSRMPFGDDPKLGEIAPAPLPNPGLPQFLARSVEGCAQPPLPADEDSPCPPASIRDV